MLDFAAAPVVVSLHTGADRYGQLMGRRLAAARHSAGWTPERLALGLTDVLGVNVSARELLTWEEGRAAFRAGMVPAALDVMGISEAEVIGLGNPDAAEIARLGIAVARVRGLLNDPAALMRRATELLEGRAPSIL